MASNRRTNFIDSYERFREWPKNLLHKCEATSIAERHKSRLEHSEHLFSDEVLIPYFDIDAQSPTLVSATGRTPVLDSEDSLKAYHSIDNRGGLRRDTACRVVCLNAPNSRDALRITRDALCRILSYYQIMADIVDFLVVFGLQDSPTGIRFSGFRSQTHLSSSTANLLHCDEIGRNGQRYQICYNLKAAAQGTTSSRPWSIRQTVLHHQFDVINGKSFWLTVQGNRELEKFLKEVMFDKELSITGSVQDRFKATLEIQRECCRWLFAEWQAYIEYLEGTLDRMDPALTSLKGATPNAEQDEEMNNLYRDLLFRETQTAEARMALESNIDMLGSLEQFYKDFCNLEGQTGINPTLGYQFHRESWKEIVTNFVCDMRWIISDLRRARDRTKGLSEFISDRRSMVIKSMEFNSTQRMQGLSYLAKREAVAVRIISLVTLIFLPCTVVSSFYSTDVVHYESDEGSGTTISKTVFSKIAMYRWLQVALPLTAITLLFGFVAYTLETHLTEQGTRSAQISERLKQKWPRLASFWPKPSSSDNKSGSSQAASSVEPKGDNRV